MREEQKCMCEKSIRRKQISTMGRKKIDLVDDELLAEEFRKYKYLNSKSCASYKDKFKTKNAWKEVILIYFMFI